MPNYRCLLLFLTTTLLFCECKNRTFTIDYENDCFLKDGQPFRYISGSMHYFRTQPEQWADRLAKMKYAGLNAVQTYIEWALHEPRPGLFDFETGRKNLTRFILEAQRQGLLVILRPGPYICAERDMGGLPYWLLKHEGIRLRTSDRRYLDAVDNWFEHLFPVLQPLLYQNGGPIIMMQIENEYGSYWACDHNYTNYLHDRFVDYFRSNVVLFTTDGNSYSDLKCGAIPNVFATVDFGTSKNLTKSFEALERYQPRGPKVNSEYYAGWLDHWAERHEVVAPKPVADTLDDLLAMNASVNIYMFHGGTNFRFEAGSNYGATFEPQPTSYDYDAPLTEAGDLTLKFFEIRTVIELYNPPDRIILPPLVVSEKMHLPPIELKWKCSVFDVLDTFVDSRYPLTFEQLDHPYGYMLYTTQVPFHAADPAVLSIPGLHDRAQVFVDKNYVGTLSRVDNASSLPLFITLNSTLDILVENQGRVSYGSRINETKGIVSNVTLGRQILTDWRMHPVPAELFDCGQPKPNHSPLYRPSYYGGQFVLPNLRNYPLDTFLQPANWTKGVAYLNGYNLGRYWPGTGPQVTLYAPSVLFKPYPNVNEIVLFETERAPCSNQAIDHKCSIQFIPYPIINASVPIDNFSNKSAI